MEESVTNGEGGHRALLVKAAALCGGLDNLAYVLDTRTEDLFLWIVGAETIPDGVMREAFVVVSSIRSLPEAEPGPTHERAEGLPVVRQDGGQVR
jgi:hypothetical protein